jgi:hypothetical protein
MLLVEQVKQLLITETCLLGFTCTGRMWKKSLYDCVFPILLFSETKFNTFMHNTVCMTQVYEMYSFKTALKPSINSQLS